MRRSIFCLLILVLMASIHAQDEPMFELVGEIGNEISWNCCQVCDIDGDSLLDVLGTSRGLDYGIYRIEQTAIGSSDFAIAESINLDIQKEVWSIAVCDLDANSLLDLIVAEWAPCSERQYSYFRFEQSETNSMDFAYLSQLDWNMFAYEFCDIDSDGRLDMFAVGIEATLHYEQDPFDCEVFDYRGYFMDFTGVWGSGPSVTFGNTNRNDKLDAIFARGDSDWVWLEQNANTNEFEEVQHIYPYEYTWLLLYADLFDFNNDGYDDLLCTSGCDLYLFKNNYPETLNANEETISISSSIIQSAYPNPFNPETTISLDIAQGEHADLTIYNTRGQKVKSWKNLPSGEHQITWGGKDPKGKPVTSGIYMVVLRTDNHTSTKKVSLIK